MESLLLVYKWKLWYEYMDLGESSVSLCYRQIITQFYQFTTRMNQNNMLFQLLSYSKGDFGIVR